MTCGEERACVEARTVLLAQVRGGARGRDRVRVWVRLLAQMSYA